MNKDTVSGKFEQATGKIKEKTGNLIGNQKLANQGVADQIKGMAKETYGNVKDAAHAAGDHASAHTDAKAREASTYAADKNESARDSVRSKAEHIKDAVNQKVDDFKNQQNFKADKDRRSA